MMSPIVPQRLVGPRWSTLLLALLAAVLTALLVAHPADAAESPAVFEHIEPGETTIHVAGTFEIQNAEAGQVYVRVSTDETNWEHGTSVAFIPEGGAGTLIPFEGTVTGLEPETTYFLSIETQNNTGSVRNEYPETGPYSSGRTKEPTPVPPLIADETARSIGEHAATLSATLNPRRFATTYVFEYASASVIGTEGWASPNVRKSGVGSLPADNLDHVVSYQAFGLAPATEYRWRISAENTVMKEALSNVRTFTTQRPGPGSLGGCPNELFRSGASALMPDCRAYEQVTPPNKNGVEAQGLADWLVASSDSNAPRVGSINTTGSGIPAGEGGRQDFTPMVSSLEGGSWSTRRAFPPETAQARQARLRGISENLEYALVEVSDNPNRAADGIIGLDLVDTVNGSVTQIAATPAEAPLGVFQVDAVADNGSYAFFESRVAFAPGVHAGVINLYRWDGASGSITAVGMVPTESGEELARISFGGAFSWKTEEGTLVGSTSTGGASAAQYVEAIHAISPDGGEIYFTGTSTGQVGQLYLRRGLDGGTATTLKVSEPNEDAYDRYVEEEAFGQPLRAAFQEATPDGSRAFFLSSQHLTADASTGEYDEGVDLYRFDAGAAQGHRLVDITGGLEGAHEDGARVLGLLGTSADGTAGYFVASEKLAEGASAGSRNIYRFEEEEGGEFKLTFVATLSSESYPWFEDSYNWSYRTYEEGNIQSGVTPLSKASRVSADGSDLLFTSTAPLTGYDNNGCGPTQSPTEPCQEIFMYSAQAGEVMCLSCNPTGEVSRGGAELTAGYLGVPNFQIPEGGPPEPHLTRNLSANGDRVFFQSPDSLVSGDQNGEECRYLRHLSGSNRAIPSCLDVYEWEAPGTPGGNCQAPEVNGGCLYLLSSGDSSELSDFVDASPDGSNVFIATSSQLVPADKDDLYDLYDVRTNGGLAGQFAQPAAPCEGEGCRAAPAEPSVSGSPGTSTFVGPGNATPAGERCKKGYVKTHGRCVKKSKKPIQKKNKKRHEQSGSGKGGSK